MTTNTRVPLLFSSGQGYNIPILFLESRNISFRQPERVFHSGGLQALGLIEADPPRIGYQSFSAPVPN